MGCGRSSVAAPLALRPSDRLPLPSAGSVTDAGEGAGRGRTTAYVPIDLAGSAGGPTWPATPTRSHTWPVPDRPRCARSLSAHPRLSPYAIGTFSPHTTQTCSGSQGCNGSRQMESWTPCPDPQCGHRHLPRVRRDLVGEREPCAPGRRRAEFARFTNTTPYPSRDRTPDRGVAGRHLACRGGC
jgi:hypothetical protein